MPVNRGQGQPTRWYRLCFVPSSADSSDDSDTESVVLAHTSIPSSSTWEELSPPEPPVPEPEIDWLFPPPPPPRLLFPPLSPPPPPPPPLPPQLRFPPLVVLPSTPIPRTAALFGIESSQHDTYQSPSPIIGSLVDDNPLGSFSLVEHVWPEAESGFPPQVPDGVMNAIRMVRISELHELDKPSQCPICMEEFKVGDQACQLPCNHTYRSECILRWLNNNKTCPVCRLHLDGWEGGSDSRGDLISLDPEPEIPVRENHINSNAAWEYFFPSYLDLTVPEHSAGENSDEGDYGSACDELCDSNEDGDIVGASQSGPG